MLRRAYQAYQPGEDEDDKNRHAAYLRVLRTWEDEWEQTTTIRTIARTPSRTESHSSSNAASQGRSPTVREPLQHLRTSTDRPLGVFSRFQPPTSGAGSMRQALGAEGNIRQMGTGGDRRGQAFTRPSPLAHLVGIEPKGPPEGIRPSPFRAGIRDPTTTQYQARVRPGTLGEGFGTVTGSVPHSTPHMGTAMGVGPEADLPPGGAAGHPAGAPGSGGATVAPDGFHHTLVRMMDQICDKLADNGPSRSTRLKFPDLKVTCFNGDEAKFLPWLLSFQELISLDSKLSDHYKVVLLKQHLGEGVKEQLKFTGNQLSYAQAMDILLRKYARPGKVQDEYRRKLQQLTGPSSSNDYKGLEALVMSTRKYLNALELLGQSVESVDYLVRDKLMDLLPAQMESSFRDFLFAMYGMAWPTELHCTEIMDAMETFAERHKDGYGAENDEDGDENEYGAENDKDGGLSSEEEVGLDQILVNNWNDLAKTCLGHRSARPKAANGRGPTGIENQ